MHSIPEGCVKKV